MSDFFNGLVDHRGQPIRKAALKAPQASASTGSVRQPVGGHPAAGLTPQRLARILKNSIAGDPRQYLELAEDMEERHEHYLSVLSTRKLQVSGLEVSVIPASDDARDVAIADEVKMLVERAEFQDELFDILDALGKSFSCTQIIWETSAKQWMPVRLEYEHPTSFAFDTVTYDEILLRTDRGNEPLLPFQWIVHRAKVKSGLTIRGGLARAAAWSFFFKSFTAKDWAIFVEAYGQPLRLGKYGPGASDEDKDTLLRAVTSIGSDYAAIVPETMAIDFVKADISGSHDLYERRMEYLDRQMSKVVLGQVGTTDAVAGGFAGNKVHNEVREDIERDDARKLSATINRDLIVPFVMLNHGPQKRYPKVKIGRPDEEDVEALVSNVAKLVPLGVRVSASGMREKIGAPEPKDDADVLQTKSSSSIAPAPETQTEANQTTKASMSSPLSSPDAIELAVDEILADNGWVPLVEPMIAGMSEKLAAATSEAEARLIIAEHVDTMGVDALTDQLAKAVFVARLAGEADQDIG